MRINDYYPRRLGELYFLVNIHDNDFFQVSESVYDLVSFYRGKITDCGSEMILTKYNLTKQSYEKALARIERSLYDS